MIFANRDFTSYTIVVIIDVNACVLSKMVVKMHRYVQLRKTENPYEIKSDNVKSPSPNQFSMSGIGLSKTVTLENYRFCLSKRIDSTTINANGTRIAAEATTPRIV